MGDAQKIHLPKFKNVREGLARLCGLRCIHTHPVNSPLSQLDLSTLAKLRLDLIIAIGINKDGTFSKSKGEQANYADIIYLANISPKSTIRKDLYHIHNPQTLRSLVQINFEEFILSIEDEFSNVQADLIDLKEEEKAILVGLYTKNNSRWEVEGSIKELESLAITAGAKVLLSVIQKKTVPDPALYAGKGKVEELGLLVQEKNANIIIVDAELSPRQQKNLESMLGVKTIDRTELILDIFAQRAQTKEGKIQVELAQLKYLYPRLMGEGITMSRQMGGGRSGGIATRGPGETKLEIDRRAIRKRIQQLERDVEQIRHNRQNQRKKRISNNMLTAALVGYTNTGKSTLLNVLSNSSVFVEDKLFATLDPTTRRITLPDLSNILLIDTVGFIQKLPTSLVAAFRATLEEVTEADIIIHVIDLSHPDFIDQVHTVNDVLTELGVVEKPIIQVFNKSDLAEGNVTKYQEEINNSINHVIISATNKLGLKDLLEKILKVSSSLKAYS